MLHYKTIATPTLELLKGLLQISELRKVRLVGGTALALQIGHRTSVDLDFFAAGLDEDFLAVIAGIKKQKYTLEIRRQSSKILICMINQVKVDIVDYPYDWLDKELREDEIVLASLVDIAAMKLSAVTNRGTKKDFIDIYYLLESFSLEQMLEFYTKKYDNSSTFMVLKSLLYFEDADMEAPPYTFDQTLSWADIKNKITKEVEHLI